MGAFLRYTWDLLARGGMAAVGFLRGADSQTDPALWLLLALMIADQLSGLAVAALGRSPKTASGGLSSKTGFRGLLRKGLMLLVVLLSYVLDRLVGQGAAMFRGAVTWFYVGNEAISLLENLALAGVPVPKRLRQLLEELRRDRGGDDDPPDEPYDATPVFARMFRRSKRKENGPCGGA